MFAESARMQALDPEYILRIGVNSPIVADVKSVYRFIELLNADTSARFSACYITMAVCNLRLSGSCSIGIEKPKSAASTLATF